MVHPAFSKKNASERQKPNKRYCANFFSGRIVPASTVFLDHSHSAARLPSTPATGRAPPSGTISTSAFGFPKFTFRTTNSIASSATPALFNPFATIARSVPKATTPPQTPAAVATQNTATTATSEPNFGGFYFFPKQYFQKQQPQYSAIIEFNPKAKPLHRPQGSTFPSADSRSNGNRGNDLAKSFFQANLKLLDIFVKYNRFSLRFFDGRI